MVSWTPRQQTVRGRNIAFGRKLRELLLQFLIILEGLWFKSGVVARDIFCEAHSVGVGNSRHALFGVFQYMTQTE